VASQKDEIGQLLEAIRCILSPRAYITLVQVDYAEGDPDIYVCRLPAAFARTRHAMRELPHPYWPIGK